MSRRGFSWLVHGLVAASLALPVLETGAQPQMLRFQHLQSEHGLSQVSVYAIYQDHLGFIWLGTQDGLNRWDGEEFTVYTHDPDHPETIPHSYVRAITQDQQDRLWVGTLGGLALFDRVTGRFTSFRKGNGSRSLSGDDIRDLYCAPDGALWVASIDGGVDRVDVESLEVTSLAAPALDQGRAGAAALTGDEQGRLWIGLLDGLATLPPGAEGPVRFQPDVIDGQIIALFKSPNGPLWAGTEDGLLRVDIDRGEVRPLDIPWPADSNQRKVHTLLGSHDDHLWLGTDSGLYRLAKDEERFLHFSHDPTDPKSLAEDRVVSLFQDRGGLLWAGTSLAGADRVDITQPFRYYRNRADEPGSLPASQVVVFGELSPSRFLIGTIDSGLLLWDQEKGSFEAFKPPGLENVTTMSILAGKNGDLWIGTRTAGLARRPAGEQQFRRYTIPEQNDGIPVAARNSISALLEDSKKERLWLGTFGAGLARFEPAPESFHLYPSGGDGETALGGTFVTSLLQAPDGQLWLTLFNGGLNRFDPETERFQSFAARPDDTSSLPSNSAVTLHLDKTGRLWVGTLNAGLARLESEKGGGQFSVFNLASGLPSNAVNGIEEDEQGRLWLSTNKGLARLDPESGDVRTWSSRHGLPDEEFLTGSHLKTSTGEILVGSTRGFIAFDPAAMPDVAERELQIQLASLSLGNRRSDLGTPLEDLKQLRLGAADRQLTLDLAALDYAAPAEIRYRYRLDGFDEEWVEMDRRRPVTYTNLDPGHYVFQAAACTADGLCNDDAIGLAIDVDTPPWQTWWAMLGYILAVVGMIYGGTRWRLSGLKRRSQELEEVIAQRTAELSTTVEQLRFSEGQANEAQRRALKSLEEALEERRRAQEANSAKSAFLSNMSHELRTPLNAMLGFAQLMERDPGLSGDHRESLGTILRSGDHLLGLINDVLSLSKIEAGKLSLASEVFAPARMLDNALDMVRGRAEEKGLALASVGTDSLPLAARGDSGRLLQILVNLLSNAVKFTDTGKIELRTTYQEGRARFEVEDTGTGIAPADVEKLFQPFVQSADGTAREGTGLGLTISRRLAELMGGEMEVWSELGKGSTFAFEIPLPEAASRQPRRRRRRVSGLELDQEPPKILVVDDAEENRRLLRRLLSTVGIKVKEAADGAEAVESWGAWKPELIFMDIRMPGMSGDEAARRIRQAEAELGTSRTIIVALTATAFEHDRRKILSSGCDDLVTKPFQEALLFDKIAEHLDVRFIYKDAAAVSSETPSSSGPTPPSSPWRVLLAEDNTANQLVARRMLERLGIDVEVVGNGRAAVDAFSRQDFDLVLMDVRMPEMDGLRATRRLRQRLPRDLQPVIIALTGLASEDERRKCLDAGMDAVQPKPFRLDDLESLVENWLPPPTSDRPQPRLTTEESVTDLISREDVEKVRRTAATVTPGTLDYRKLEALRQLDRGTEAPLATQVIDLFLDTVPSQVDELRRSVADGDRHRWRRIAHSLKNSSATLGADELADACKELEELGRLPMAENLPTRSMAALERLVGAATEALAALENER